MNPFLNTKDIKAATGGMVFNDSSKPFTGVSIDSRTIIDGELFIALKGETHDGHDFVSDALKNGSGAIIEKQRFERDKMFLDSKPLIVVEDTLKALHNLASYIRSRFHGNVFAVAGSNGKTTTKELLSSILSTRLDVLKTTGNYNNHIGMPLCICRMNDGNQAMVLEMGTNMPGDIDNLCGIAKPDTAVITNIGYEHIEGFGSLEKVRESELEILPHIKNVVVNSDDWFLMDGINKKYKGKITKFGIQSTSADVIVRDIDFREDYTGFFVESGESSIFVKSRLLGLFNVYNCLAAAATAITAGFDLKAIKTGIESFGGVRLRFELKRRGGITFLNDVYNANPSSMEASVMEMMRFIEPSKTAPKKYKRAIVVLGDMLELGDYSITAHKNLGKWLSSLPVDIFIGVGEMMAYALSAFSGEGSSFETSDAAGERLHGILKEGDIILIKGSRGMKMENVLAAVERLA